MKAVKKILIILLVIAIFAAVVLWLMPQGLARRLQGLDPNEIVLDYSARSAYFAISKSGEKITFTKFFPLELIQGICVEYKADEWSFALDGEEVTISDYLYYYTPLIAEISPIAARTYYLQDARYGDGHCVMGVSPDRIDAELTGSVIDFEQVEIGDGMYAFLFCYYYNFQRE